MPPGAGDIVELTVQNPEPPPARPAASLRLAATLGTAAGVLSLLAAFVAVVLGALAVFVSTRRTGTEALGVMAVVFFQLVTVVFGGYVLPAGLIALRHPLGWIGRVANFAVLALTAIALWISYGRR
jgi:uncharacterized membrane protein YgcG